MDEKKLVEGQSPHAATEDEMPETLIGDEVEDDGLGLDYTQFEEEVEPA